MGLLNAKKRNALPDSAFGLPDERKYPLEKTGSAKSDREHAANAKARASGQVKKGNLSKAKEAQIDRRADKVLKK